MNTLYSNNDGRGRQTRDRSEQNGRQSKQVILPPVNSTAATKTTRPWLPPGPTRSTGFSQGACVNWSCKTVMPNEILECLKKRNLVCDGDSGNKPEAGR